VVERLNKYYSVYIVVDFCQYVMMMRLVDYKRGCPKKDFFFQPSLSRVRTVFFSLLESSERSEELSKREKKDRSNMR
jgi:hypothetical protein